MDSKLYEAVIETFLDLQSVKATADVLHVSPVKVRKVLITEGLWTSRTSAMVADLLDQGLTTSQIAARLCTTEKAVQQYLPYSRGLYGGDIRSVDALRSAEYRRRIAIAQERVLRRTRAFSIKQDGKIPVSRDGYVERSEKMYTANERSNTIDQKNHILCLHMELIDEYQDLDKNAGMKYGNTISRDILVPADIQLWALHYVIQASFGWQNSHLHCFNLPAEKFIEVTGNCLGGWNELVGTLFRAPEGMETDESHFWADDYEDGSFKTWLRKKYKGPYISHDDAEDKDVIAEDMRRMLARVDGMYKVQYREIDGAAVPVDVFSLDKNGKEVDRLNFRWGEDNPIVETKIMPWEELPVVVLRYFFDGDGYNLLERLRVTDVFDVKAGDIEAAGNIEAAVGSINAVKDGIVERNITELIYCYDYGDGWKVSIKVVDPAELIKAGRLTQEELDEARATVEAKYRPVMIAADGFNAIDDVGGLGGLSEFYRCVEGGEPGGLYDNKADAERWARGMGWSRRKVSLKNRL